MTSYLITLHDVFSMRLTILRRVVAFVLLLAASLANAQSDNITKDRLKKIQRTLDAQEIALRGFGRKAADVLYFSGGVPVDKTGFCVRFWKDVNGNHHEPIPNPLVIAQTPDEKSKMFALLRRYAKNNFDLYVSQRGVLSPDSYLSEEGRGRRLGPVRKGNLNALEGLPKRFADSWDSTPFSHGLVERDGLFDPARTKNILYLEPYPISGYVRPLLLSLMKDACDGCSGISIGVRVITVDGLRPPDFSTGELFSKKSYVDAYGNAIKNRLLLPRGPYLLMGLRVFDGKLILWTFETQKWVEPSARELEDGFGYFKPNDVRQYFRTHVVNVIGLDEPSYIGPEHICSIQFNVKD